MDKDLFVIPNLAGAMALNSVTAKVGQTSIIAVIFILNGAFLLLTRRKSFGYILYAISMVVLGISTHLIVSVLSNYRYWPFGKFTAI